MPSDKPRKPNREEFKAACDSDKLGRPPQRKRLQWRLADVPDTTISAATHGDDPKMETNAQPPREDRAG